MYHNYYIDWVPPTSYTEVFLSDDVGPFYKTWCVSRVARTVGDSHAVVSCPSEEAAKAGKRLMEMK